MGVSGIPPKTPLPRKGLGLGLGLGSERVSRGIFPRTPQWDCIISKNTRFQSWEAEKRGTLRGIRKFLNSKRI